jgi:predicted ArsR family transcriptional regulator
MAGLYRGEILGRSTEERMHEVSHLMSDRDVPFTVERGISANGKTALPILTAKACPYPDLAEQDRGICGVEKMLFSELLGENVRLSECRLDGASCCRFETN